MVLITYSLNGLIGIRANLMMAGILIENRFLQKTELGIVPKGTELTPRDKTLEAWDDIPVGQRNFQTRLMEVFAGYVEHTDHQVGRLIKDWKSVA